MSLGPQYCSQLKDELRLHANFPPNRPIALGDYGVLQDSVFRRLGNLAQLGISFETVNGQGVSSYQFKSKGNIEFNLVAKGDVLAGGVQAVKAGLELKFTAENAVFFNASGCVTRAIDDLIAIERALIGLLDLGQWEAEFHVVTEVTIASRTTAIASADRNCEVKLEASSPAIEAIQLGDPKLDLQVKSSKNTSLEVVTADNQIPLMQLSRLRGIFHQRFRPEALAVAGSRLSLVSEDGGVDVTAAARPRFVAEAAMATPVAEPETLSFVRTLETIPTGFDAQRAISVYIPLLNACYDFSHGNEHPGLPPGFEIVAQIVTTKAGPEALETLTPEARAAVENDFRAMEQEARRTVGPESVARPDAFGFVFRDVQKGSLIVGIRGTQTPEEWLKDFTAIPVPFSDVSGFGLVHLGFLQMWNRVRPAVLNALRSASPSIPITFLGHSLGAGIAELAVADMTRNLKLSNLEMCTFGSPRPAQIRFRVNFNHLIAKAFRVAEVRDVVTMVPALFLGWNHVGIHIPVRSRSSSPHSLDSYKEGLQHLGHPTDVAPPAGGVTETLSAGVAVQATREL